MKILEILQMQQLAHRWRRPCLSRSFWL